MIIVRIWEGLGNQMFQYAFAKSFYIKTGQEVFLDCKKSFDASLPYARDFISREYMLKHFRISIPKLDMAKHPEWNFLKQDNPIRKILYQLSCLGIYPFRFYLGEDSKHTYNEDVYKLKSCYMMGWFQNEKYFKDIRDELLDDFRLKKKIKLTSELKEVLEGKNTVSLHVRRGDYRKINSCLDKTYYERAIQYMNNRISNPVYVVFSDEVDWVREHIDCHAETVYIQDFDKYKDYEELVLMSKCRNNIIANSSFSWWGAWLNENPEKVVIAPKTWFRSGKDSNHTVPDEWIKI